MNVKYIPPRWENPITNDVKNKILTSFDSYLNSKYEIKINEKTLERMRNYFK